MYVQCLQGIDAIATGLLLPPTLLLCRSLADRLPGPLGQLLQVHYGRASMTKLSRLPAFFVFPEEQLNIPAAAACLAGSALLSGSSSSCQVLVFLDQPLLHCLQQLKEALLALVEQQQGPAAAARLVFPAVPQQQMEPEQPGGQPPSGCCGGGSWSGSAV